MCYICHEEKDLQQYSCYCGHLKYHLPCLAEKTIVLKNSYPYPTGFTRFNDICEVCDSKIISTEPLSDCKRRFLTVFSMVMNTAILTSLYYLVGYKFNITGIIFLSGFCLVHPVICFIYLIKMAWTRTLYLITEETGFIVTYISEFVIKLLFIMYIDLTSQLVYKLEYNQPLFYIDKEMYYELI